MLGGCCGPWAALFQDIQRRLAHVGFLVPEAPPSSPDGPSLRSARRSIHHLAYCPVPCVRALFHVQSGLIATFIPCQPSLLCCTLFLGEETEGVEGVAGGAGVRLPTVSSTPVAACGQTCRQSRCLRAVTRQALRRSSAGTRHVQLTHLPIDLCGPHSACVRRPGSPRLRLAWHTQCLVRPEVSSAALTSWGSQAPSVSLLLLDVPPTQQGRPLSR